MRLNRPKPMGLLLWPTLWALWLGADKLPNNTILMIFLFGVVIMRSAGCIINDYADRHIDGSVARTKDRPLVTGAVSPKEALILFGVLCFFAFLLVVQLNVLTMVYAGIGLILAIAYPFMKRYTYFPQVVLGMAWYMSVPMAFAAQQLHVPLLAWYVYVIAVLWAVVYDSFYAMADREDDIKIGVKSTVILFGKYDRLIIGILQVIIVAMLLFLGWWQHYTKFYYLLIIAAGLCFIYQQWLAYQGQRDNFIKAFLNNNYFGLLVFLAIGLTVH